MTDSIILLIITGFIIGSFGTLIGAGGGFILVPILIITAKGMPPEIITAISIAVVAANAISGSVAYSISKRIDYKAGILFGLFTIPGSIGGVFVTKYIPLHIFNIAFGILLISLATWLLFKRQKNATEASLAEQPPRITTQAITDNEGNIFTYTYNRTYGIIISIIVGFISPLLGIGGGIIHVPVMVEWLGFPVLIATATSHFVLAIMSTISVIVHIFQGSYNDPHVLKMVAGLCVGVIPGAQLGAYISHRINTKLIIKILALCLILVGLRILL